MRAISTFLVLVMCCELFAMDQLRVAYEWRQLDFAFPSDAARQAALERSEFVPKNNIPMGLEVYDDRLFVTVGRWRDGVPASLNYIFLNETSTKSPKLIPYPNWAAHKLDNSTKEVAEIIAPFRVRADKCGRLWVLDTGRTGYRETIAALAPPALIIYDLKTDQLLRKYVLPADQWKQGAFFTNIAVEDMSCEDTFAYASDNGRGALLVYSWAQNESWLIHHHYFNIDPMAGDFNLLGLNFHWKDAVFSLALTAPDSENYSTLYFHPMTSFEEFSVSTKYLRNATLSDASFHKFKHLGSRGPNGQATAAFIDKSTGVLFYGLINLSAVACWKTTNPEYTMKSQGRIYMNNMTMVFPSDIKVDYNHNLWVLSNRIPKFLQSELDPNDVNFRILTAPVIDAISHTACDITPRMDIINSFVGGTASTGSTKGASIYHFPSTLMTIFTMFSWFVCSRIIYTP